MRPELPTTIANGGDLVDRKRLRELWSLFGFSSTVYSFIVMMLISTSTTVVITILMTWCMGMTLLFGSMTYRAWAEAGRVQHQGCVFLGIVSGLHALYALLAVANLGLSFAALFMLTVAALSFAGAVQIAKEWFSIVRPTLLDEKGVIDWTKFNLF